MLSWELQQRFRAVKKAVVTTAAAVERLRATESVHLQHSSMEQTLQAFLR